MIRSFLFVPGDSLRKFERASAGEADALILDLEDSVSLDRKAEARGTTRAMLEAPRGRPQRFVRVNALDTGLALADLAAIMPGQPDGIVLPKCAGRDDILQLSHWLDAFESAAGLEVGATKILAIATETAASLFGLGSYPGSPARLWGLMWGAEDLAASLGATENMSGGVFHSPYRLARDLCLAGAAAAGLVAVDTVYTDIDNLEGLEAESRAARRDGFGAKAVIHPKHIEAVNRAFTPSEAETEWARKVVAAFAQDAGLGVIRIDGRMIDRPHLRAARKILGLGEA
jgi:citrate lyase subunit beta/citryl-CoA lyase